MTRPDSRPPEALGHAAAKAYHRAYREAERVSTIVETAACPEAAEGVLADLLVVMRMLSARAAVLEVLALRGLVGVA